MHFWINKPAGRSRVIGGCTRYHAATAAVTASSIPASIPLLKTRVYPGSRREHTRATGSMISSNRFTTHWSSTSRPTESPNRRRSNTNNNNTPRCCLQQSRNDDAAAERHSRRQQQQQPTTTMTINANNVSGNSDQRRICGRGSVCLLPNVITDTSIGINHGILEYSEIGEAELAGNRLLYGIWITFVLATGFVSIAKFHLSNKPDASDVLIVCGLLTALLVSGCLYLTLVRRTRNYHRNNNNHHLNNNNNNNNNNNSINNNNNISVNNNNEIATRISCTVSYYPTAINSWTDRPSVLSHFETPPSPSPPPYHIAIQIPQNDNLQTEAPPPSYEKATRPAVIQQV